MQATRILLFGFVTVLFCGCSSGTVPEDGLAPFQGEWKVLELSENGRTFDPSHLKRLTLVINKAQFNKIEMTSIKILNTDESSLRVDTTKTPHEIDFVLMLGAEQGRTRRGIYAFEEGKLRLAVGDLDGPRPAEFAPGAKTTLYLLAPKQG